MSAAPLPTDFRIPKDLTGLHQFCLWIRNHEGQKIPVQPNGQAAKSNDPLTWCSYAEALTTWRRSPRKFAGIANVFSKDDPNCGIDLDDCLYPDGSLKEWARPILERFPDTYCEVSPSGTGLKLWVRAKLPGAGVHAPYGDGQVELYDQGRYFTLTGCIWGDAPLSLASHQATVSWLLALIGKGPKPQPALVPATRQSLGRVDSDVLICKALEAVHAGNGRNHSGLQLALQCRDNGYSESEALGVMRDYQRQCPSTDASGQRSPYTEREVSTTVRSAYSRAAREPWTAKKPPQPVKVLRPEDEPTQEGNDPQEPDLLSFLNNDAGNAQRIIALHGKDLRYCYPLKKWLLWDGRRWLVDTNGQVRRLAKRTMVKFLDQAIEAKVEAAEKFARQSLDEKRITTALGSAECEIFIDPAELDTHPHLLNCLNGTVDLHTGELLPHDREQLITKLAHFPYDPSAECPTFLQFLAWAMGNHPDAEEAKLNRAERLIGHLQKVFGYALTGYTSEKVAFFLHGNGNNGKSTLLYLFFHLLEEYSVLLQIDTLMVRQESNNTQADLADLRGARFVITSETEEGQRLAEGKLKRITQGMGKIKAVRKYENPIEFPETHKLFIDANHLPVIKGTDNALWNRLYPIPFEMTISDAEKDEQLPNRLKAEANGVLAWAVEGAVRWGRERLGRPQEIEQARSAWREEMDPLKDFLEERCVFHQDAFCKAANLRGEYEKWAEEMGHKHPVCPAKFRERLLTMGCSESRRKFGKGYSERAWNGLGIISEE